MKKLYLVLVLALLAQGCSRGSGTYVGQVVDASWEGWIFKSCEVEWKTSDQSSTVQVSSSHSKELCDRLQDQLGKKFKVRYTHRAPKFTAGSFYIIDSIQEVQ